LDLEQKKNEGLHVLRAMLVVHLYMGKKALIIGATGLVGSQLVELLGASKKFSEIICFVRRSSGRTHRLVTEKVVDFSKPETWSDELRGDVLFSCLGTTLRDAGTREKQYEVDFTYQYQPAQCAAQNGVGQLVLVSSAGASPTSGVFYSRMKGELEEAVRLLPFNRITVLRPSILRGNRTAFRMGERIGIAIMTVLGAVPGIHAYRPVHARTVAMAMIESALAPLPDIPYRIIEPGAIHRLAASR